MPGLLRKLIIFAAVDGLVLQSPGNGQRNSGSNEPWSLRIDYMTNKISSLPAPPSNHAENKDSALEAYGLVGLLSVASYSFLISITQRQQVAQVQGKPIYAITNVAIIPISSQTDASRAIAQAKGNIIQGESGLGETASEDGISEIEAEGGDTDINSPPASPARESPTDRVNSIAEEVIEKRAPFGRFATNWLSRKTLGLPGVANVSQFTTEVLLGQENDPNVGVHSPFSNVEGTSVPTAAPAAVESKLLESERGPPSTNPAIELLPKLLRYTKIMFSSRNFFFSYDYDLTRSVGTQGLCNGHIPMHKAVDQLYFWNRNLMVPFIEADAHSFVLPLIQGFVGQREFTVAATTQNQASETEESSKEHTQGQILGDKQEAQAIDADSEKRNYLLTLISRRSVKRPGLRYTRRGVDDDGNTANTVETEQILSVPDWDPSRNVYSYLQVRGSIPLYFSQSPYAFKPIPVLHHAVETNQFAFARHFRDLSRRYGKVQAVSLVDKHAGELLIGEEYERYMKTLNESGGIDGTPVGLEWFDFHHECRGMKFENVSQLVNKLEPILDEYRDMIVQDNTILQSQNGIVRTNCMDCLDRTGVAQCAFGQWALERELKHEGMDIDLSGDSSTQWFNTLWADNGDAISKQYSSTAALKGDYTRTRKRNYRGALNDLGLTLSRYYNNIVNDYFSQACVDYLLGNVSTQVFQEFTTEMQTTDPGISVQKVRQNAIETSCTIVINDQEEFLGGWTMLTPRQPNTLRTLPFEESVLLLTDAAVYSCRFDWNIDKVVSFERIDLRTVSRINYGTYITSTVTESQADERRNVGLVIEYRDGDENMLRVNTRSLQSNVDTKALENDVNSSKESGLYSWFRGAKKPTTRFVAFKALPLSSSVMQTKNTGSVTVSEMEWVRSVCKEIERAARAGEVRQSDDAEHLSIIEQSEIISLEDAKKRTGILEHLVYDIKKLVWV